MSQPTSLYPRKRDPQRRRDIYVVDEDGGYHSIEIGSRLTLEAAQAAMAAGGDGRA